MDSSIGSNLGTGKDRSVSRAQTTSRSLSHAGTTLLSLSSHAHEARLRSTETPVLKVHTAQQQYLASDRVQVLGETTKDVGLVVVGRECEKEEVSSCLFLLHALDLTRVDSA